MILRAHVVLPISRPALGDGAVVLAGKKIVEVGRWRDLRSIGRERAIDLGDAILMPGLINAHCHLDYTLMAGEIPPPKSFTEWLKVIVSTKAGWALADYQASWKEGAQMLLQTGTTTVADMEAVPELLPHMWQTTPLRVLSFLEMIGITPRRPTTTLLRETLAKARKMKRPASEVGLSPHAPYSTLPDLLRLSASAAQKRHCLLATHVAESAVEYEMFTQGRGEMFEWLQRSGRDMSDCGLGSPVQHLEKNGLLGENLLAAHVNYLRRGDSVLLGRRKVSVVHCPRSHSYFHHDSFPFKRLAKAGVNICLGTDSLASVYKKRHEKLGLDMFAEMRGFARRQPFVAPGFILSMATMHGARALRLTGRAGELSEGTFADMIAIPFSGSAAKAPEAAVHHEGPVMASMIGGVWAKPPAGL